MGVAVGGLAEELEELTSFASSSLPTTAASTTMSAAVVLPQLQPKRTGASP
jgi:hypothetical protein